MSQRDAEVEGALDRVHQRLLAGGVAVGALEAPALGPAAVAVHHRGHVRRDAGGVDAGDVHDCARLPPRPVAAGTISGLMAPSDRLAANTRKALEARHRGHAGGRGPRRPGRDGRGRGPGDRRRPPPGGPGGHRAPASPSPTWCPPSSRGARWSWPPPPRPCRTSSPARTCPSWQEHLDQPFTFAVLKGRSNYVCLQRLRERRAPRATSSPSTSGPARRPRRSPRLARWAESTAEPATGPSSTVEPSLRAWAAVSVRPGSARAPASARRATCCFAERARRAAADADVVVVNTHLYGLHLATGGAVLPEHDLVVVDEAHQLEDTVSATAGVELTAGPLHRPGPLRRGDRRRHDLALGHRRAGRHVARRPALDERGRRLRGRLDGEPARVLALGRARLEPAMAALRQVPDDGPGDVGARKIRADAGPDVADRRHRRGAGGARRRGVVGRGHRGQPRAAGRPGRRRRACWPSSCGPRAPPCSPAPPCPAALARPGRPPARRVPTARRRQPLRLRAPGAALLRRPPARPPRGRLRRRASTTSSRR